TTSGVIHILGQALPVLANSFAQGHPANSPTGGGHMWKRDEAVRPPSGRETTTPTPATPSVPPPSTAVGSMPPTATRQMERDVVNIGKSVVIKGELAAMRALTMEGQREGRT